MHNFAADLQAAQADLVLQRELLAVFRTPATLAPGDPGVPNPGLVTEIASVLLDEWHARYTIKKPLRFVVSDSKNVKNALACWTPTNDWVVVSLGLLWLLSENADRLSRDLLFVLSGPLNLQMTQRLRGDVSRSLAYTESLYAGAVAFFIGHEIAHLYDGHEGFRGHSLVPGKVVDPNLTHEYQALELGADYGGTRAAGRVAMKKFIDILEAPLVQGIEDQLLKRELLLIVSLGPLLAFTLFQPEALKQVLIDAGTHPDDRYRALWMVSNLMMFFDELKDQQDPDAAIEQISLALTIVLIQNAAANDALVQLFELAPRDGDMAVLRTSGIRRLLFSEEVTNHHRLLYATYGPLKDQLQRFARGPDAMPMQ